MPVTIFLTTCHRVPSIEHGTIRPDTLTLGTILIDTHDQTFLEVPASELYFGDDGAAYVHLDYL